MRYAARVRFVLVSFLLLAACGARTDLRGAPDASIDAALPPPANGCTSAISGAAPMRGYCSTRAHFALYAAPTSPIAGWQLSLATDFQPVEMVVDDAGRLYATIDPVRGDDALIPYVLVVVDAHGTQIAQHDFRPDAVGNLFVARDGVLRATVGRSPRRLVEVDAAGNVTPLGTLPPDAFRFAIASDGSLVSSTTNFHDPDHVVRVRQDGSVMWTSPPIDDGTCGGCMSDVVLGADDRVVIAAFTLEHTTMRGIDSADGSFAWQTPIDGIVTEGPSIARDGSIRVVTGVTDAMTMVPTTIVTALSADGAMLWQTRLPEDYQQTWDNPLPIAADGTTFVHTFHSLIAVAPDGRVRWRNDTPTNLSYDAVVDASGALLVLVGPIRAFDVLTGVERWHVDGPGPMAGTFFYVSNFVLAPRGCLVGASHGGTLFSACDR